MKARLHVWFNQLWYSNERPPTWLTWFSFIFQTSITLRRWAYRVGLFNSRSVAAPVIVVGNLSVGGTGKSPLVRYIAQCLTSAGFRPGIVTRGYGGKATCWPQSVDAHSDPSLVGDEAVMLASNTGCPVVASPKRVHAAQYLLSHFNCNVIISDDGLQHYALHREIEIVVIDGERRFGNDYCLPAGPLREPITRLQEVDLVVVNGVAQTADECALRIEAQIAINLKTQAQCPLSAFQATSVHALAGIGNPQRFFTLLTQYGINYQARVFPDHYAYQAADLQYDDTLPVLMTEKDAVKCRPFASVQHWYVPIEITLPPAFAHRLLHLLSEKVHEP